MNLWFLKNNVINEKDRQVADILSKLIFASWFAYLAVLVCGFFFHDRKTIVATLAGGLVLLAPFWLLHRGKLLASSWVLSLAVLGTLTILATIGQGHEDLALIAYPTVLIFTSITLSRKLFTLNVVLMIAAIGWLVFGQMAHLYTPQTCVSAPNWFDFLLLMVIILLSAFAIDLLIRNIQINLKRAEDEIAQRKPKDAALQESELRYRQLFDSSPDGVVLIGPDGLIVRANIAQARMYGYDTSEGLNGMYAPQLVAPSCRDYSAQIMQRRLGGEEIPPIEYEVLRKDGTTFNAKISATILRNADQTVSGYICVTHDISEQKHNEEQLRQAKEKAEESEARYRLIANNTSDSIWVMDANLRFTYLSPSTEKIFGYSLTEWQTLDWNTFVNPDYMETVIKAFSDLQSGKQGKLNPTSAIVLHKNGTEIWVEFSANALYDENNVFNGAVGITRDITPRKLAEVALKRSKNLLSETELIGKVGGWSFNIDTMEQTWTDEVFRIHEVEISPNPSVGRGINFYTAESRPIIEKAVQRAIEFGEEYDLDLEIITAKGNTRAVHAIGKADLKNRRIYGFFQDITERKKSEQEYKSLFREMREAFALHEILCDAAGKPVDYRFLAVNPAFERMTGLTAESIVGRTVLEAIPDTEKHWIETYGKVALSGEPIFFENYAAGLGRHFEVSAFRPAVGQFACIFQDITKRKCMEEALQKTQKLESLGLLAGGIAHDFNNLLGGIYGYIDLAAEGAMDEQHSRYLSNAMVTIERARGLTLQLLTFAKGGAPIKKVGDLFPFVQEAAQFALSGSNVSCTFAIQPDLCPCDFDKNQIGQVIDNIVINAKQAMADGGAIAVSARNITVRGNEHPPLTSGDYVVISIKDSGIGIPKNILPKIFDPFYTTKATGHGLGLATCFSIVNRHGGCIEVESEPGEGSTFHIFLPASCDTILSNTDAEAALHKGTGVFLVMDDQEIMRDTIGDMLDALGYTAVCTETGKEAIAFIASAIKANRNIAGMIFDLTIPGGMGGKEAIDEIRKMDACTQTPVFVTSGYAEDPIMANPDAYGFTASICKPFRKTELSAMLNNYMGPIE